MANENEFKVILGADTEPLKAAVSKVSDAIADFTSRIDKTADRAVKGFDKLNKSAASLPGAFDAVVKSSVALSRINKNIEQAATAAEKGRKSFDLLGQTPLNNLPQLDAQLKAIKATLSTGLKANLDTSAISPEAFNRVAAEVTALKNALLQLGFTANQTDAITNGLVSTFKQGFSQNIVAELNKAGVSVDQFQGALSRLTGGGANLSPLISILAKINTGSTQTSGTLIALGNSLEQVGTDSRKPLSSLEQLDQGLRNIKTTLAGGFDSPINAIKVPPADFSQLQAEVREGTAALQNFGNEATEAFGKVAAGTVTLTKIDTSLAQTTVAAEQGRKSLDLLGKTPLNNLPQIDAQLKTIRATLSSGLKANLDTSAISPAAFSKAAAEVEALKTSLVQLGFTASQTDAITKALVGTFQKGFSQNIVAELNQAGVSVKQFQSALSSLTAGGANLTPLVNVLSQIEGESATTSGVLKVLRVALDQIGVGAKVPLSSLDLLDQGLRQIKATLSSGFESPLDKIKVPPADFSQLQSEVREGTIALQNFGNEATSAFSKVGSGAIVLSKIDSNLNQTALAADQGRKALDLLGKTPLNNLPQLDAQLKAIKSTLATGLKANVDTSGLNPQTFDKVTVSARDLINVLLLTADASKNLSGSFNIGFAEGIVQALQEAGVSVQEFRQALVSLNASGVNLTPLVSILDQIEKETGTTTDAVKILDLTLKQLSAGGPPPFPLPPLGDINKYNDTIKQIKATLASGVNTDIGKITLNASDFTTLEAKVNAANGSIKGLGNTVQTVAATSAAQFDKLGNAITGIPEAVNNIKTSPLEQLRKSIGDLGAEALQSGKQLAVFVNSPKTSRLKELDNALRTIKNTINSGFNLDKIKFTGQNFSVVARGANQAAAAVNKLKSSSSSATLALTDVSRVAQDLPFGFLGIANNINPMVESFARLKRETGTTGGALKALAGSLTGVGGLGLAVGVVTAAIQIYQNGILGFNRKTNEAKDSFEEFKKSLRDASTISGEATASVQGEILRVGVLARVAGDVTKSTNERKRALEELHQTNQNIFGDYTLEAAALGKLKTATDEYTKALIAQAIAKGFADEISKVSQELRKQETVLQNVAKAYIRVNDEIEAVKTQKAIGPGAPAAAALAGGVDKATAALNAQVGIVGQLRNTLSGLTTGYKSAIEEGLKFRDLQDHKGGGGKKEDAQLKALKIQLDGVQDQLKIVNELRKEGILPKFREDDARELELKVLDLLSKIDQREVQIKIKPKLEIDPQLNELQIQRIEKEANARLAFTKMQAPLNLVIDTRKIISQAQAAINETLRKVGVPEAQSPGTVIAPPTIPEDFNKNTIDILKKSGQDGADAYNLGLKERLGQNISVVLSEGIGSAFASIGEGLGEIFSGQGGGLAAAAEGFLAVIGSVLQEVGKQIILASALVATLKKAIASLFANPAAGFAVGLGLIALGTILKKIQLTKVPKFAEGAIVRGPTFGMVGEAGPEAIVPLSRMNAFNSGGQQLGFVASTQVRGEDLLVVIKRAAAANSRMGGNF